MSPDIEGPGIEAEGDFEDEDDYDPEEADRRISEFIDQADRLPGPSVAELADTVHRHVTAAWDASVDLLDLQRQNKIVATMLLLSRRARETEPSSAEHWQLNAASTLVSGMMIPDEREARRPGDPHF